MQPLLHHDEGCREHELEPVTVRECCPTYVNPEGGARNDTLEKCVDPSKSQRHRFPRTSQPQVQTSRCGNCILIAKYTWSVQRVKGFVIKLVFRLPSFGLLCFWTSVSSNSGRTHGVIPEISMVGEAQTLREAEGWMFLFKSKCDLIAMSRSNGRHKTLLA